MSKKIMKRSLALGALMAFVIIGSAWAAGTYVPPEKSENGKHIYKDYRNVTNNQGSVQYEETLPNIIVNYDFVNNSNEHMTTNKLGKQVADGKGGAIYWSSGDLTIKNSTFKNNSTNEKAGAIDIYKGTVVLENNEFINNSSVYWGGAMEIQDSSANVILKGDNIFSGNAASNGGAIAIKNGTVNFGTATGSSSFTLFENNIAHNKDNTQHGGGAILISKDGDGGILNFYSDVEFNNNEAVKNGGAINNQLSDGVINFKGGTAKFRGNQSGVKYTFDAEGKITAVDYSNAVKNDIYNAGTVNIDEDAVVILDGGITGEGKLNVRGLLNGTVYSATIPWGVGTKTLSQNVELKNGVWDLAGNSVVSTLNGSGTIKVDFTKNENVTVLNNGDTPISGIKIDHGGIIGVDVRTGVENIYKAIVDADNNSLVGAQSASDVFLQANVEHTRDTSGNVTNVTTTIKPGDALVISNGDTTNPVNVKVNGNIEAESFNGVEFGDLAKTEYVDTELAKKADKSYVDVELAKKADITYVDTIVGNAVSGKVDQTYVDAELNKKADKATTLAGYGIADAYTKNEVNAELDKKANQVDVETALDLKADKTALETEATTREKADIGLQKQINNLSTGSNEAIAGINQRLGKMNGKINKVGAGAAALAALHPLDYDPDDKLTFSAGVGNYAGENAAALGAFYRPDEKLMFSLGGTMGNGENMVNLGVSIGLDGAKGAPKLSRKELVQKVSTMEAENQSMKAEIAELKALVAELVNKK